MTACRWLIGLPAIYVRLKSLRHPWRRGHMPPEVAEWFRQCALDDAETGRPMDRENQYPA